MLRPRSTATVEKFRELWKRAGGTVLAPKVVRPAERSLFDGGRIVSPKDFICYFGDALSMYFEIDNMLAGKLHNGRPLPKAEAVRVAVEDVGAAKRARTPQVIGNRSPK